MVWCFLPVWCGCRVRVDRGRCGVTDRCLWPSAFCLAFSLAACIALARRIRAVWSLTLLPLAGILLLGRRGGGGAGGAGGVGQGARDGAPRGGSLSPSRLAHTSAWSCECRNTQPRSRRGRGAVWLRSRHGRRGPSVALGLGLRDGRRRGSGVARTGPLMHVPRSSRTIMTARTPGSAPARVLHRQAAARDGLPQSGQIHPT